MRSYSTFNHSQHVDSYTMNTRPYTSHAETQPSPLRKKTYCYDLHFSKGAMSRNIPDFEFQSRRDTFMSDSSNPVIHTNTMNTMLKKYNLSVYNDTH
jgi:hypothetical protein